MNSKSVFLHSGSKPQMNQTAYNPNFHRNAKMGEIITLNPNSSDYNASQKNSLKN